MDDDELVSMFTNFGNLDFGFAEPQTETEKRTVHLKIDDKFQALFTSATWTLTASVDGKIIAESTHVSHAHSESFIKRWTRQAIRLHSKTMRSMGVDVEKEYVFWGGDVKDL